MAKKKATNTFIEIDYSTEATPRAVTPDGIPVFCAHDDIIPIEKAIPNPKNPNQHSQAQIELLGNIIKANGWRAAVTISKRSGFIVKGHGRRLAALYIKSGYIPVDYQDYASEAEEWADLIADNRLAELSTLDTGMLVDLINEMDTGEVPVEMTGYTEEDLAAIIAALEGADDEKQYIIWVKNAPVLGHADYQWAHEPCFYAEKAGQSAHFYGDRSQRTTWKVVLRDSNHMATVLTGGVVLTDGAGGKVFLNDKPPKGKKIRYIRLSEGKSVCLYPESKASTVWEVARETGTEHPTQKPVELAIRAIDNSSKPGDLVLDFFGGSGSTLIGAEMTGRRCNMVELDPRYCDVIINRYVRFKGNIGVTCLRDGQELTYMQLKQENDKLNGLAGGTE